MSQVFGGRGGTTLENGGEVGIAGSRVPELDVFVGPPGDACVAQRDADLRAVGVVVIQLQRVWNGRRSH